MSPVSALVVMLVACALGCRAELNFMCEAHTGAMKDVAVVLDCYGDTAQESLQINKVNRNSLQSLSDTVHLLKKQMTLENEKTLQSMKQEIQGLIKVGTYKQEIQELKEQVERKDKEAQDLTRRLQESQMRVQQLDDTTHKLDQTVQNLEERLSVSVQQVDILTEIEKEHTSTVQDLDKRLQESELHVEELESTLQKINETMECKEKDPACRQTQLQKIKDVVQRFNSSNDLTQLVAGLESVMDSSSEEYQQLQSVGLDGWFTFWIGNNGYTHLATLLLCAGLPVDTASGNGYNMLSGAADAGQVQLVRFLLQHGAQVDARGGGQSTPLIRAAYKGHLEVVKVLVEAGASTTARDQLGQTALEAARLYRHTDIVQYLQQLQH